MIIKRFMLSTIVLLGTLCFSQNNKKYVDSLVLDYITSLENREITDYFYMNKYCDGNIEMFILEDGSTCSSRGTYYEVYVFWKEDDQAMIKKIDNCGMYFSLTMNNSELFDFVVSNIDLIKEGEVKKYTVQNPENVPTQRTEIYSCKRNFQFELLKNSFGQDFNLYDLTNESKYQNLNYEYNNELKIVALEKMIQTKVSEMEPKFRRQF